MEKTVRGAFVGLTNLDYVYYLDSFPEENAKCKTCDYVRYVGGPAANAAITYASLGGDATLFTALGSSQESWMMEEELRVYGVRVVNLAADPILPSMSMICISGEGKRTIISGQTSFQKLLLEGVSLEGYDFALFDCNQQDISLPLLQKATCEVVLDAGSFKPNMEQFLQKASIVIASEHFQDEQGQSLLAIPYPAISHKAITRGEKSILMENGEIEVPKVDCVDSLAAGDIFHGAFCYGYYEKGDSFEDALRFASVVAAKSVQYRGPREWMNQ